jgi:hypothetical protein
MLKTKKGFIIMYCLIWALVFAGPYLRNMQDVNGLDSGRMIGDWIHLSFLFLVFLVNLYFLVPKLLFNNKRKQYVFIVILTILVVTVLDILTHPGIRPDHLPNPAGPPEGFRPGSILGVFFTNIITGILIIGTGTAFKLEYKWLEEEKLRKDMEKEQLKTNLALLRHQVSPHFFMNTLNNIHTLIETDAGKAQDAVERLSTLMRYLLYDSAQNTINLKKEIEFIHSYISLMQLRHSDEVEVTTNIPEKIPDTQIPPMLFISLIENAFKHGACYPLKSYIHFELKLDKTTLLCIIKNSKHPRKGNSLGEYSGIGLDNIKESLQLLYQNDYQLDIFDKENEFEVRLSLPL